MEAGNVDEDLAVKLSEHSASFPKPMISPTGSERESSHGLETGPGG